MISSITPAEKLSRPQGEPAAQLKGICATCIHAPTCAYVETPDHPKMYCEQFESELPAVMKTTDASGIKSVPAALQKESETIRQARSLGLCANCIHRETCVFPRPEGGVWHCEEYA